MKQLVSLAEAASKLASWEPPAGLFIEAADGRLTLRAAGSSVWFCASTACEPSWRASCTVDARSIAELARTWGGFDALEQDAEHLLLARDTSRARLRLLWRDPVPPLPPLAADAARAPAVVFADALHWAAQACAHSDARPALTCVQLQADDGWMTLRAADGFRLHQARVTLTFDAPSLDLLLPRALVPVVAQACQFASHVELAQEDAHLRVRAAGECAVELSIPALRYRFPDTSALQPPDDFATVDAAALRRAVRAANDALTSVKLTMSSSSELLRVSGQRAETEISASGADQSSALDAKFLLEALPARGDVRLHLHPTRPNAVSLASGQCLAVIMPIEPRE